MIEIKISRLGKINKAYDTFALKEALIKNDAGDWGSEPDENALGIIRSTNFSNEGKIKLNDIAYRTLKPSKVIEKTIYTNDILVERSGGSDSQPVGRVLFVDDLIGQGNYAFANFIQRIAVKNDFESKYIFYCLQQMYEAGITASMQNQTTGIRNLDWKLYIKTILPKPPKPEQTAIASILSQVDETIEAITQSIKASEKLKKAMIQNLLSGKLKPDGLWRTEDEFYEDEKFGRIPKGWEVDRVKNLTNKVTDGEHLSPDFQSSGSYLLSAEDIFDDGISFKKAKYVKPEDYEKFIKRCNPEFGDVLIVSRGASIGRTCQIKSKEKFCLMGSVILVKPNNKVLSGGFISQYFKSYGAWLELQKLSGTTAQQAIYLTHIKKVKLAFPKAKDEQEQIANCLELFDIQIGEKQSKIKSFERLKKSLMQQLLTGKKRLLKETITYINQTL